MDMLKSFRTRVGQRLAGFAKEDKGSVAIEAALLLPFMLWAFLASFVYYDAFRQSSINLKAAYTIGDMVSRETAAVNDAYVSSLQSLFEFLTRDTSDPRLRVSVAMWDDDEQMFRLDWSEGRGEVPALTESTINAMQDQLPNLPDAERIIVVETWSKYSPIFNVGLDEDTLYNMVFTSPRFAPQVAWAD